MASMNQACDEEMGLKVMGKAARSVDPAEGSLNDPLL